MSSFLNQIINDDCLNFLPKIEPKLVDMALYDIPYYTSKPRTFTFEKRGRNAHKPYSTAMGEWDQFNSEQDYFKWVQELLTLTLPALKENGALYLFCKDGYISTFKKLLGEIGYLFKSIIVWHKQNPMLNIMHLNYTTACEWQLFALRNDKNPKSTPRIFNWLPQKAIRFPKSQFPKEPPFLIHMHNFVEASICMKPERIIDRQGNVIHKTQKPIEILLRPILVSSNKQGIILDATCGMGSTCEASKLLRRNYIGCEKNPLFYDYATKRLNRKLPHYHLSARLQYIIQKLTAPPSYQHKLTNYIIGRNG